MQISIEELTFAECCGEPYNGSISVGDTLEMNGLVYAVVGINEDGIVVKEIKMTITVDISDSKDLVLVRLVSEIKLTNQGIGDILETLAKQFKSEVKDVSIESVVSESSNVGGGSSSSLQYNSTGDPLFTPIKQ